MTKRHLLPGVSADLCAPIVVGDSHRTIRRARTRAIVRDVSHVLLLAGVDYLFVRWPNAHVPMIDRSTSVVVLAALNSMIISHVALSRVIPKMTAKRIATTWCLRERARFFQAGWR